MGAFGQAAGINVAILHEIRDALLSATTLLTRLRDVERQVPLAV
jgi:hypothetical protein